MKRIGIALLLLLLLPGCGGVSKEDYDAVVRERDALRTELQETKAELQELRDASDTMTVTLKGSFTATVRALIREGEASPIAVVELFQSTPFFLSTGKFTEQLEVGKTYVFEIETREIEILASDYASGCPDPVDLAWYDLQVADFRAAAEADWGLGSCHLVYET